MINWILFFSLNSSLVLVQEGSTYGWNISDAATRLLSQIFFEIQYKPDEPVKCNITTLVNGPIQKINSVSGAAVSCQSENSDEVRFREFSSDEMTLFGYDRSKWLQFDGSIAKEIFIKLKAEAWKTNDKIFDNYPVAPIVACDVSDEAPFSVFNCSESYYLSGTDSAGKSQKASLFCNRVTEPVDSTNLTALLFHPGLDATMAMRKTLSDMIENELSFGIRAESKEREIRCFFLEP